MDKSLPRLTERLLGSYRHIGGINNIEVTNVPSKRAIGAICEDLLQILFPGFHDEDPVLSSELADITQGRIASLGSRLEIEIRKALHSRFASTTGGCPHELAHEIFTAFLEQVPAVREVLRTDVEAAYEGDPAAGSFEEIIVSYPFLEAIAVQRLAHVLYRRRLPLIPRMMTEWAHGRTGIDIHPGAQIGTHFFIDHGTGVVIGETCVIGDWVKLYHGVTLGAKSFQKDDSGKIVKGTQRHPRVGDRVTIYPNSTVLGGDTFIGSGTTIGGNVFLMQSVPEDSLVYYEETQLKIVPKRRAPAPSSSAVAAAEDDDYVHSYEI
ncbi:MAG: serine acetyltransferase [Verrucomicrobia bacterium]|nr:serine acetyltransferase [Verrucomicrobiota bacterium]MBV9658673.1 serine acetyltransferase [Verrucomicrobiota bacterium]